MYRKFCILFRNVPGTNTKLLYRFPYNSERYKYKHKNANDVVEDYLNLLNEYNYESTINEITRSHGDSGSCINHIFVKSRLDLDPKEYYLPVVFKL